MKKHVYLKFAGTLVLFALVGAAIGYGSGALLSDLGVAKVYDLRRWLAQLASQAAFWVLAANLVLLAVGFGFCLRARNLGARALEKEVDQLYEKAEEALCRAMTLANISVVLGLAAFGVACCDMDVVMRSLPLFIIGEALGMALQHLTVRRTQALNPEKKGSVFEARFVRQWYDSCDEAQREQIGWAAFKSFRVMQSIFAWAFVPLAVLGCYGLVGPLVFLVWGGLWMVQMVSYSFYARKAEKGQIQ